METAPAGSSSELALGAPDALGPTRVRTESGRAAPYERTWRRVAAALARVPITRVYDATALDYLGVPVWGAVTPLARDLTVHAGKGASAEAARLSAVMEAVERVCAETAERAGSRHASFTELAGHGAVDPEAFDLPFETTYSPDRVITWVQGYDLLADRQVWVARDLAISPAREGVCLGVDTNGLAAGNNFTEAAVHGLSELIERDAASIYDFARLHADAAGIGPAPVVDPGTLPAREAEIWERLGARGRQVELLDLTHDLGVPVFRAVLSDSGFPGAEGQIRQFEGFGCDLDAANALGRALCEAAQSHTGVLIGARDSFEAGPPPAARGTEGLVRRLLAPVGTVPFSATTAPEDLHQRLIILLDRLHAAGLRRCVIVDLTRPDLGIPVVRMLVPGLAAPYGDSPRRPTLRMLRTLL